MWLQLGPQLIPGELWSQDGPLSCLDGGPGPGPLFASASHRPWLGPVMDVPLGEAQGLALCLFASASHRLLPGPAMGVPLGEAVPHGGGCHWVIPS